MRRRVLASFLTFAGGCEPPPQASPMKATVHPEPGYDFAAEERAYLDELDRLRHDAKLGNADRVADSIDEGIIVASTQRILRGAPQDEELRNLIGHFTKKTGVPFTAQTWVTSQLNGWRPEYPADLLTRPRMGVVVTIVHTRSRYVVTVIFGDLDFTP